MEEEVDEAMHAFLTGRFRRVEVRPEDLTDILEGAEPPSMGGLVGKRVIIFGTSRADLNGQKGSASTFDAAKGRYGVLLDKTGKSFAIKPENLQIDKEAPTSDAAKPEPSSSNSAGAKAGSSTKGGEERGPAAPEADVPKPPPAPDLLAAQQAAMMADHRRRVENPGSHFAEREATLKAMSPDMAESELRNEALLADAKRTGNQGNLVVRDGKMALLTDAEAGAVLDKYEWGQTETEVTIKARAPEGTTSKEVALKATSDRLRLVIAGDAILDGLLYARIVADGTTFSLEDAPPPQGRRPREPSPPGEAGAASGDETAPPPPTTVEAEESSAAEARPLEAGPVSDEVDEATEGSAQDAGEVTSEAAGVAAPKERLVTIVLTKLVATSSQSHWKCVVQGEPEIDTSKFGPPIRAFDPIDTYGLKHMFA